MCINCFDHFSAQLIPYSYRPIYSSCKNILPHHSCRVDLHPVGNLMHYSWPLRIRKSFSPNWGTTTSSNCRFSVHDNAFRRVHKSFPCRIKSISTLFPIVYRWFFCGWKRLLQYYNCFFHCTSCQISRQRNSFVLPRSLIKVISLYLFILLASTLVYISKLFTFFNFSPSQSKLNSTAMPINRPPFSLIRTMLESSSAWINSKSKFFKVDRSTPIFSQIYYNNSLVNKRWDKITSCSNPRSTSHCKNDFTRVSSIFPKNWSFPK